MRPLTKTEVADLLAKSAMGSDGHIKASDGFLHKPFSESDRFILNQFVAKNEYIPHQPFFNQSKFLVLAEKEALYGGSAGGGKSDALLMAALMFVGFSGYNALILRKTYSDLALPEAIMSRSHEWLAGKKASWNGSDYRWTFPSGATLSFGYLNHDKDKYRYQSSAFQGIFWDELTQFPFEHYSYLFSRLRRLADTKIPLRMRGATNPGGVGHHWVHERFIVDNERPFIPSKLDDNPYIDRAEYRKNLSELDETTRRQLEDGEWVLDPGGKPFNREWWRGQNRYLPEDPRLPAVFQRFISLDTALEVKETNDYTAWTVGELTPDYRLRVMEVGQERLTFPEVLDLVQSLTRRWNDDGKLAGVLIEGKASGKPAVQSLRSGLDSKLGRRLVEIQPRGSKVERMNQAAVWAKRGMILLPVPGDEWLADFERELFLAPEVEHDDRTDSLTQLVIYLENFLSTGWHGVRVRRHARGSGSRVERAFVGRT